MRLLGQLERYQRLPASTYLSFIGPPGRKLSMSGTNKRIKKSIFVVFIEKSRRGRESRIYGGTHGDRKKQEKRRVQDPCKDAWRQHTSPPFPHLADFGGTQPRIGLPVAASSYVSWPQRRPGVKI